MIYLLIFALGISLYINTKFLQKLKELDMNLSLLFDRWNQLIYTIPSKKEYAIKEPDNEQGHRFLSLEGEISEWGKWISHGGYSESATGFCQRRIDEIKKELDRRGFATEWPYEKLISNNSK